jgi:nitroreductase
MSKTEGFIPFQQEHLEATEMISRSSLFYENLRKRRSVRTFSDEDVPFEVIKNVVSTAGTAPSGANKQPWTFCIIRSQTLKSKIKAAAEEEEFKSYSERMSDQWLKDLEPIGTDWQKPFLEIAPWIIVVFKQAYNFDQGNKVQHYYVNESVGIACGFLIAAIHNAGLCTLTHTPSPMNFLSKILERPDNERPYLLLPIGYPARDTKVPNLKRKGFEAITVIYD